DPRTLRRRRGELLRSGRQSPGRERSHARALGRHFILPATVPDYLARTELPRVDASHPAFREAEDDVRQRTHALLQIDGRRTVDSFHRELGRLMWDNCGMARSDAGLRKALARIPELRKEFHKNVRLLGTGEELNQALENAGRVADLL